MILVQEKHVMVRLIALQGNRQKEIRLEIFLVAAQTVHQI